MIITPSLPSPIEGEEYREGAFSHKRSIMLRALKNVISRSVSDEKSSGWPFVQDFSLRSK